MSEHKDILAVNLQSAARDIFKHWYILGISAAILLGTVFLYLRYVKRTYSVGSSVLLKLENNNRGMGNNNDFLQAFDFMGQDRNLKNEVFFLQSIPLVSSVVKDMDLRIFYYVQDSKIPRKFSFGMQNIYKSSPIIVLPQSGEPQPVGVQFYVDIIDDEKFFISAYGEDVYLLDFETERNVGRASEFELNGIYDFGAQVKNEHTSFQILLNSSYKPENQEGQDLFFQFNNLNHIAHWFKGSLQVTTEERESTMATLQFETENASLGIDFLNNLIAQYIEENMDESNMLANKTIEHIDRQLTDVSDDLSMSEQQLQNLRSSRNVMNIEEKSQNIYQQMQTLRARKEEIQMRFTNLRQLNDYFVQYKDSAGILAPSALG
ncbi:MAG: hypothetical protein ACOC2E_06320, partial [Bacteroidota bacterium]